MKISAVIIALACLSTSAFSHENGTIKIYDAKFLPQIVSLLTPGNLVMVDGKKKDWFIPKTAMALNSNLEKIRDYFASEHGRKSWDDKGSDINAALNVNRYTVIDILGSRQNAAWMKLSNRFIFGAGSKKGMDNFETALDVVGHEYTHAVIQTTSALEYVGQSGALNEHFADVFGSIINQHYNPQTTVPYIIGATVISKLDAQRVQGLRDMMDPLKGLDPQPSHMKHLKLESMKPLVENCVPASNNDNCGVHVLSGIPNKMAALVMTKIGIEASGKLFYNVMTKRLTSKAQFSDYRNALMIECKSMSSDTCQIVDESLKAVGL